MKPILFEAPEIHYNTYTSAPRQAAMHDLVMARIKGKRTGVQPYYHEKKLIVKQNGFGGIVNFTNMGTQFEWLIISIIPVLSKDHGNTYATYNAEKTNRFIRKIRISNMKEAVGTTAKVYDLTEFDGQLTISRQFCAFITNTLSTNTFLDFSSNIKKKTCNPKISQIWKHAIYS